MSVLSPPTFVAVVFDDGVGQQLLAHDLEASFRFGAVRPPVQIDLEIFADAHLADFFEAKRMQARLGRRFLA